MAKKKAAKRAPKTQKIIDGAFPDEVAELEDAIKGYDKTKHTKTLAADNFKAAYDTLKAAMRDSGLETYWSYRLRKRVVLKPDDPAVKVEDVKIEDPTPFSPK